MKAKRNLMQKTVLTITITTLALVFSSCATTKKSTEDFFFAYKKPGIKIEAERMSLTQTAAKEDRSASGSFYVPLPNSASELSAKVLFEPGTYECLVCQKAADTAHSFLTLTVEENSYALYPSNPPLGVWELTTRCPVYLTFEEKTEVRISLKANAKKKSASPTLCIDYMQFVKQ